MSQWSDTKSVVKTV
jgi:hypothetical protein